MIAYFIFWSDHQVLQPFLKFRWTFSSSNVPKIYIFAAARMSFIFVTRCAGNKAIFSFGLRDQVRLSQTCQRDFFLLFWSTCVISSMSSHFISIFVIKALPSEIACFLRQPPPKTLYNFFYTRLRTFYFIFSGNMRN